MYWFSEYDIMALVPFVCEWKTNRVEVYQKGNGREVYHGHFNVITKPLCEHCGNPDMVKTSNGYVCFEDHYLHISFKDVDGAFQLGYYYKKTSYDLRESGDILNSCIWRLKRDVDWATPLAQSMFMAIQKNFPMLLDVELIVPVPNHILDPNSDAKAVALANQLGNEFTKFLKPAQVVCALRKVKNISTQGLNQVEREEAVIDMFEFNPSHQIENKTILLVDDVLTAGNTKGKCATILKENGAKKVWIMVAGRNK